MSETIATERLDLVWMSPEFMTALLDGRRGEAAELAVIRIPADWPTPHDEGFLRFRVRQMEGDAEHAPWLVRAITLRDEERTMIGHAGFHGKPGFNAKQRPDAVEIGYQIFEPYRGRGYATETVRGLIDWAVGAHGIHHFVASVGPDNAPSLAIVRKLGFEHTGEHWDEEDGRELEFELSVGDEP